METHKTLIFVPTYNECDNAPELFKQILALGLDADILFLDDNSPDGTGQVLDELAMTHPCLHVIHRTGKLGIGSAHVDGIQWAYNHGYTRLVTMDCDFTHSPADIPRLFETLSGCDVVVGSRWIQADSLNEWNAFRKFLTGLGHFLTRDLLKVPFDATGAFRVYDLTRIPRHVFNRVTAQGYAFFFESLFLLIRNNYRVREIPIMLPKRTYGHSKMRIYDAVSGAGRIVKLYFAIILNPEQFCVPEPFTQLNPHLVDPQNWDEYWEKKKRATSVVYDVIAATYRNLIIKPQLNRFIRKHFTRGSKLLHAGCGSGQVDSQIQREMLITEVDISASALALCRKHNPWVHRFFQTDIMDLPFPDGSFEGAYNLGVMEHFEEAEIRKILLQLHRVIKPGGKAVLFWPHARATSVLFLNLAHWVINRILKQNVRLHPAEISLFRSRREIEPLLEEVGFHIVDYYFGPRDMYVQAVLVMQKTMKKDESLDNNQPVDFAPTEQPIARDVKWMRYLEMACGVVLLLMVIFFHVQMMSHGGGLWRDEINTFNMASLESLGDIIKNLEYDSFPILWLLILRGWISAGLGSEIGLRILGMLIGIGGTLSLVWVCRTLGSRFALVALVLLGFSPTAYLIGDSLRAYGFGMMLMFLTLGFFWKAVQDPSPRQILLAGLLAILSVQCLYYNSVLLFAMGMGGVAVGLRNRDFKKIAVVLGIGATAALTMIPYWGVIERASSWNILFHIDFTIPFMMGKFREAIEPAGAYIFWIWLALAACVWRWFRSSENTSLQEKDRVAFIFTTLVVAVAGYTVFLRVLSYPTQPWYYLSIMAMMAVTLDAAVSFLAEARLAVRIVRLVCVLLIAATTTMNTWNAVHTLRTNVDLFTARLESLATKNDLIVVSPFFIGISFAHYYKGDTPWVAVPLLTEYRIHRYDMFKEKMAETKPLTPVHDKIQKTLQAGNRVWVLGVLLFPQDGELPGELPPAPHSPYGWSEAAYSTVWSRQTAYLLQQHATEAGSVAIDYQGRVNPFENVGLLVFQGWHP